MMDIEFGELEGSVYDGEKEMMITTDNELTLLGMVSVAYEMKHVGATRRQAYTPVAVEAYVNHGGLDFEIPAVPVVGGAAGLAAAIKTVKAAVLDRAKAQIKRLHRESLRS